MFSEHMWQGANPGAIFPAVMRESHESVAVRVAACEKRASRRRTQRRTRMGVGEQDALRREPVEPRTTDVGTTVSAQAAAQVVPVHEQHVVASGHRYSPCIVGTPTPMSLIRCAEIATSVVITNENTALVALAATAEAKLTS